MVTHVFHRDFRSNWIKLCISSFIFSLFPFLKKYAFSVTWRPKYLPNWGIPPRSLLVILFLFPRKCQGDQMALAAWPEGQEIQALTNCIQKHIAPLMTPCWDCLASSSICHEWAWAVSSGFSDSFICFSALRVELNVPLWCGLTCLRLDNMTHTVISMKFTLSGFGVLFLLAAQEMLLYAVAAEAINCSEGSSLYKVQ